MPIIMREEIKILLDKLHLRGETRVNVEDISAFRSYFNNLFTSNDPDQDDIQKCIQALDLKVTSDMNQNLNKPYLRDGVEIALKQMAPLKSH